MQLYAQHPVVRLRQVAADVGMLVWLVVWVLIARATHAAVLVLAEPGRAVEDLGRSVAGSMDSAAEAAERVPVVGDGSRRRSVPCRTRAARCRAPGSPRRTPSRPSRPCWPSSWWCCPSAGCCCGGCRGGSGTPGRRVRRAGSWPGRRTWRSWPPGRWPPHRSPGWPRCRRDRRRVARRRPGGGASPGRPGARPAGLCDCPSRTPCRAGSPLTCSHLAAPALRQDTQRGEQPRGGGEHPAQRPDQPHDGGETARTGTRTRDGDVRGRAASASARALCRSSSATASWSRIAATRSSWARSAGSAVASVASSTSCSASRACRRRSPASTRHRYSSAVSPGSGSGGTPGCRGVRVPGSAVGAARSL